MRNRLAQDGLQVRGEWQQRPHGAAVMAVGGVDMHAANAPAGVAEHLALAPVHAFVRVEAALLAQARGQLDTLRVDQRQ